MSYLYLRYNEPKFRIHFRTETNVSKRTDLYCHLEETRCNDDLVSPFDTNFKGNK